MPRTARPWFRFYVEAMRDPKMRRLTPAQRWLWVAVLAAARESCRPGWLLLTDHESLEIGDLADYAGMSSREVATGMAQLCRLGMVDIDLPSGTYFVPAWNDRQYESDDSTKRTRKHRDRNGPTLLDGTDNSVSVSVSGSASGSEPTTSPRDNYEHDFDAWWTEYPRKIDKEPARKAYIAKRRAGADPDDLLAAVKHYAEACDGQEREHVKYAKTFLNGSWTEWVDGIPEAARRELPATIEELATPAREKGPWVCSQGNPDCNEGYIDIPGEARAFECACRNDVPA